MRERLLKTCRVLPAVLPLVFALLFLGLLPLRYTVTLYTDNIVGEGICKTCLCPSVSFSPFYETGFYFGSELKKVEVQGYHYDVDQFVLTISDVSEAEIEGFDLSVFGLPLGHHSITEGTPIGQFDGVSTRLSDDGQRVHFTFDNPGKGISIGIKSHFAPLWFRVYYVTMILAAALLVSWGLSYAVERVPGLLPVLWRLSALLTAVLAGCFFCGSLAYAEFWSFALNYLLLFALSLLVGALTLPWLGTLLTMGFALFWYVANYFVILYRGKPVMPADLKVLGTAKEVMGGYSFTPGWQMVLGLAVSLAYAVGMVLVCRTERKKDEQPPLRKQLLLRGISVAAAVCIVMGSVNSPVFAALNDFQWDAAMMKSFHKDGMVLTFLNSAFSAGVKVPEGYSQVAVQGYLEEYQAKTEPEKENAVQPTRIIMVMNEAFSDLRTVGLDSRVDVMPFIDSLDENTVEGSLYVSIFGGGTCNTEFEALTGNTLAFLGAGAYPYTENVTGPLFSLASYFKEQGYLTESFHANEAANWNRVNVYPNLGFDTFHSIEDYPPFSEETWLHEHPADLADYYFMEQVDEENRDRPRFLFNVTMQNHSGYERWEDVEEAESVKENVPDLYMDSRVYLSLIKASDDAVKQLVETYRDSDEPTMIVFFGDHQPGLPNVAMSEIYTNVTGNLDGFKSKFFIWTNYETETEHEAQISANYLPWLILERGNFPLPPYVQMLKEVHEKYPILSSQGVVDSDGNAYIGVTELTEDPLIQKYQYIQYANLYDEIDEDWFTVK